jgi:HEAT repeat protein
MQASALFAMGRSQDGYWLDLLLGELASAEAELRFESARACGQLGDEDAVPELATLADDEDQEVRNAAFTALGQIGGRAAIRLLGQFREAAEAAGEDADAELLADVLAEAQEATDSFGSTS